jgi:hypothetical protein
MQNRSGALATQNGVQAVRSVVADVAEVSGGTGDNAATKTSPHPLPNNRMKLFMATTIMVQLICFIVSTSLHVCEPNATLSEEQDEESYDIFRVRGKDIPDGLDVSKLFDGINGGHGSKAPLDRREQEFSTILGTTHENKLPDSLQPRAFPKWTQDFPCYEPDDEWWEVSVQRSPSRNGFLFMKEMKTGSSTLAGVHLRISKNVALRRNEGYAICKARFDHSLAVRMEYGNRNKSQSFLWTVLREPTARAISQFFHFTVSREKQEPSDVNFKKSMRHDMFRNYYLQSLTTAKPYEKGDAVEPIVSHILNEYDFIGITERMDESLVVLSQLLNVPLTDVLYLKAKGSGGFDDGRFQRHCTYIIPPYVSPTMKSFFASPRWKKRIVGDDYLYQLANLSLDMTIDTLGRDLIAQKLIEYQQLRQLSEETCANKVEYPCDAGGNRRQRAPGCLWQDSGCGHGCLDRVSTVWAEQHQEANVSSQ